MCGKHLSDLCCYAICLSGAPGEATVRLVYLPSFEVVCCAVAEPAGGDGDGRDVEYSAASGVGALQNSAAAPGMQRAGSCGQLEGGTKLDHYAGRLSIGGRPHYLAPDGHDIGRAGTLQSRGALEHTPASLQKQVALFV